MAWTGIKGIAKLTCPACGFVGAPEHRAPKANVLAMLIPVLDIAQDTRIRLNRTLHCAKCGAMLSDSLKEKGRAFLGKLSGTADCALPVACPSCRTINPDGAKFCRECGSKLTVEVI